ncbi:enoyl-CoA hydratase [Bosea sp. (in: a-proteobacteria)]|uniref:enoyl-CoA hydratase n=1 Tax=Bosea sp. (in: a-proteobacteria) TaxID=1871050 RepID=UPI00261715F1|nr:enoyl-CoA hydratase [Bosea sp. (in: a-proteobacteria)]MCO5089473.1 enoyl-CoA hydratase [Bosea sp. (in: a-proteobacteria)]
MPVASEEAREGVVTLHKAGRVGYIAFENPARKNAVSLEMLIDFERIIIDLVNDKNIRTIVITGAGGNFVTGADISKFEKVRSTEEGIKHYAETNERVYGLVLNCPKPTIAMIRGYCVGGGLSLAMACDLRICSSNARFSLPAAKLGLGYSPSALKWFVHILGPAQTKEIFLTARLFNADEAFGMGLVNRTVPDEALDEFVGEYAELIGGNAPLTLESIKVSIAQILRGEAAADSAICQEFVDRCWKSQDYVEGRRAFIEKRKPVFVGA